MLIRTTLIRKTMNFSDYYYKYKDTEKLIGNSENSNRKGNSVSLKYYANKYYRKSCQHNCRIIVRLACAVIFVVSLYHIYRQPKGLPTELIQLQNLIRQNTSFIGKCEIPNLDPWHPSVVKYYKKVPPLQCTPLQDEVMVLEDGILKVKEKYRNKVTCKFRTFEHNKGVSDFSVKYNGWNDVDVNEGANINQDFVEASCYSNGLLKPEIFSYHFNQIVKQNVSIITGRPFEKSSLNHPSVVVFGIDSTSTSNFIRTLPQTRAIMRDMGFIDMHHHVKVGDNTFPNWMAVLTGKRAQGEPEFKAELPEDSDVYFDDWPLMWKNFSQANYATLLSEDRPQIHTFVLLNRKGFNSTPTDHYLRPYYLEAYWSLLGRRSDPYCYDRHAFHRLQLNYLEQFVQKYNGTRSFAWHWIADLSHNFVNQIGTADQDIAQFLKNNKKNFGNSIIIMFSDHGNRYDAILESAIGRLESSLPFLSIFVPKNLKQTYPHLTKILLENSSKMTTQFDLHETLRDILQGNFEESNNKPLLKQRAYSLFKKIPANRSCHESNVPENYCPCFSEVELPPSESEKLGLKMVDILNEQYREGPELRRKNQISDDYVCLKQAIDSVEYASVRLPSLTVLESLQDVRTDVSDELELYYHLVIKTKAPSKALLEGFFIKNLKSGAWRLSGEFNRLNKYGNTSHCVSNSHLRKICYCIPRH